MRQRNARNGEPHAALPDFAPSTELERIDTFSAGVARDRNRVCTWRVPVSRPFEWFSHRVRDAIAEEVTPIVFGRGVFRDELWRRFRRAVSFITALDERVMNGRAVDERSVRKLGRVLR